MWRRAVMSLQEQTADCHPEGTTPTTMTVVFVYLMTGTSVCDKLAGLGTREVVKDVFALIGPNTTYISI